MSRPIGLLFWVLIQTLACAASGAAEAPYRDVRNSASPTAVKVAVNPPPLLWPSTDRGNPRYQVRLSQDSSFPAAATIAAEGLRWACFNAHRRLEPGRWYWQYAVAQGDKEPTWTDVLWFDLDASARLFVTPPASAIVDACPKSHPRVLATAEELPELRRRAAESGELQKIVARADACAKRKLPSVEHARPKEEGANRYQQHNFAKWASKGFAGDLAEEVSCLAPAWLLTGEKKYGQAAVRRALFVAGLDPEAETSPKVSDFADGSCMRAMALAYDSCYDLLDEAQRRQLCDAMRVRGGRFFERNINRLESRLFNPHVWQHILLEAAELAFATLGEVPEADVWASWFCELWVNRFPPVGGDDGGWVEGLSYEGTNMDTMLRGPGLLERFGQADFFDMPWYRNASYFLLYGWPAGSASAGFGDGTEGKGKPGPAYAFFAETLARRFQDPYALWYAGAVDVKNGSRSVPPPLALQGLRTMTGRAGFEPRAPRDLPQSRAFYDVGLVAMHTDLASPENDVFLAFCSCPFGAYGHMHPCQNAFNLLVGAERLFANSGYYIAFGDEHYRGWYSATRGHNAILIDGKGQGDDTASFGRVLRFADTAQASYCLGDASHAYPKAGLTKARRHAVLLRPTTILIYDELEANHAAQWSWLLHSPAKMAIGPDGVCLEAQVAAGRGRAEVFGAQPLRVAVDDRFDPPAENWRNRKVRGETVAYPDQWHATVTPEKPCAKTRFLAVLQVRLAKDARPYEKAAVAGPGRIQIGPWQIEAALATGQKAALRITGDGGQSILAVDEDGQPQ